MEISIPFFSKKKKTEETSLKNDFVYQHENDGAVVSDAAARYVVGALTDINLSDKERVDEYRKFSKNADVQSAISDIVDAAIVNDDMKEPVSLDLSKTDLSDNIKNKIINEFDSVLRLLNYNTNASTLFEEWYIDGRQYFYKIISPDSPKKGILKLKKLDPKYVKKVVEVTKNNDELKSIKSVEEYYIYSDDKNHQYQKIKIPKEAISYVHSGIVDEKGSILSNLHQAITPFNQLKGLEESTVIYSLARAPEKRVFYIDVGKLNKSAAEQYIANIVSKYKNKMVYDSTTGKIKDSRHITSMLEDYYLPRKEGTKGTEVSTIGGDGGNLGSIDNITYFRKKLFKALHIPLSRIEQESSFSFGSVSEVSRDELKFSRFIKKLRKRYSFLFLDILETQIVLKGIITKDEFDLIKNDIIFRFAESDYYSEISESEILNSRLETLSNINEYVGKYYSHDYIRRNILRQTDEEIKELDSKIKEEQNNNQYKSEDM